MHAFFKCMAGAVWLCGDSSGAEAEQHQCNCFHGRCHEQIMCAARVLMLPCTFQGGGCLPTISRVTTSVVSPALREFHCLLIQTLGTGPSGGRQDIRKGQLVSQVYGHSLILGTHVKMASEAEPQSLASLALCCLLSKPPVLPNAQHCLLAFCRPANMHSHGHYTSCQSCFLIAIYKSIQGAKGKTLLKIVHFKQKFELRMERFKDDLSIAFQQPLHPSLQADISKNQQSCKWLIKSWRCGWLGWLTLDKAKGVLAFRSLILPEF